MHPVQETSPVGCERSVKTQSVSGTSHYDENMPTLDSSGYNLRSSTLKRRLSTDGSDQVTGEKTSRRENACEKSSSTGQGSLFLPGLYKDMSS